MKALIVAGTFGPCPKLPGRLLARAAR